MGPLFLSTPTAHRTVQLPHPLYAAAKPASTATTRRCAPAASKQRAHTLHSSVTEGTSQLSAAGTRHAPSAPRRLRGRLPAAASTTRNSSSPELKRAPSGSLPGSSQSRASPRRATVRFGGGGGGGGERVSRRGGRRRVRSGAPGRRLPKVGGRRRRRRRGGIRP